METTLQRRRTMRPKLKSGVIYSADNGRLICAHCAGMSALFTGRDLSGQRVYAMTQRDADDWMRVMNMDLKCELGCTIHKPSPGVTFDRAACVEAFGEEYTNNFVASLTGNQLCAS